MEAVKDLEEIKKIGNGYNALNDEVRDGYAKEVRDAYVLDSNKVLLIMLVVDCSHSVSVNGKENVFNTIVSDFTKEVRKDPEASANVKIAVSRYGTDFQVLSGFGSVYDYDESSDIYVDLNLTDTAKALTEAFKITKDELEYQMGQGKKTISPIILHITDGLQTSEKDEMCEMVSLFDSYHRKSGLRRIKIYSITQDKSAANLVSVYSDSTFLAEDYEGITSAVTTMAKFSSSLSEMPLKIDPITGEEEPDFTDAPDLEIDESMTVLPRKRMKLEDIWNS